MESGTVAEAPVVKVEFNICWGGSGGRRVEGWFFTQMARRSRATSLTLSDVTNI